MAIRVFSNAVQVLGDPAAAGTDILRNVSDNLGLTDPISYQLEGDLSKVLEDDLGLDQDVVEQLIIDDRQDITDNLNLQQEVVVEGQRAVTHDLELTQTVEVGGPKIFSITHNLNFQQFLQVVKSNIPWTGFHVGHWVYLDSRAGFPQELSVTNNINFEDFATPWGARHDLSLVETATGGRGFDAFNELDLSNISEVNADLNPGTSQNTNIQQAVAYFIESRCGRYERNDFNGTGGILPSSSPLKYRSKLFFQSQTDHTDTVELRNPETDNRRRVAFQRVNRDLFDGTADVFTDPDWPVEIDQLYTITATKADLLEDLFEFMLRNLGEEIIVKDWDGISWLAIVLNASEVFTEDSEGYWTIDLELRSTRLDSEALPHTLSLDSIGLASVDRVRSASSDLQLTSEATYVVQT